MKNSKHSPLFFFFSLLLIAIATIGGCNNSDNNAILEVINIDPDDDSCTPLDSEFQDCAEACEKNPLGCANDILKHVESEGFISRRQLNPGTIEQKPNIQSPMHGLFVPVWNNPQLNNAINNALQNPFCANRYARLVDFRKAQQ